MVSVSVGTTDTDTDTKPKAEILTDTDTDTSIGCSLFGMHSYFREHHTFMFKSSFAIRLSGEMGRIRTSLAIGDFPPAVKDSV